MASSTARDPDDPRLWLGDSPMLDLGHDKLRLRVQTVLQFMHFLVPMMYPFARVYAEHDTHPVLYQIYLANLGHAAPQTIASFERSVFQTGGGWTMIAESFAAGFLFPVLAFALSVVSFPLLRTSQTHFHVDGMAGERLVIEMEGGKVRRLRLESRAGQSVATFRPHQKSDG